MAITTITVNGITMETTADVAQILPALLEVRGVQEAVRTPKAAQVVAVPKAVEAKPQAVKTPKAAQSTTGKQMWADIQAAIKCGDHDTARRIASAKPDTFGVQCERAIAFAKTFTHKGNAAAKVAKTPKAVKAPKAAQPLVEPKALPKSDNVVVVAKPSRKRNHRPDCLCPTCPLGVAKRRAEQQPIVKVTKVPTVDVKAVKAAKQVARKAKVAEVHTPPKAVAAVKPEDVVAKAYEHAMLLATEGNTEMLHHSAKACAEQAIRQTQAGNTRLAQAYGEASLGYDQAADLVNMDRQATQNA